MIDVDGLQKAFGKKREVEAVRGVSFAAPDGEITGLLGPNGAGKTTLLRMIATLVLPDAGHARVGGLDVVADRYAVRGRIGVLSDARGLYPRLTARENVATSVDCTDSRAQRSKRGSTRSSRRSAWHRLPIGAPRDSRRASG
jgi:sodium transport system ATP-binding protein